jgi:two-component system LytT family response regulator
MTAQVLIVEDERPARAKIRRLLSTDPRFTVIGEACDGIEGLTAIEELAPDLVFLDVQMPGLDGFELLDALGPERRFVVVFSTAHDEHALRAFDEHAVDYLLKPYDGERFRQALDKAARLIESGSRGEVPKGFGRRIVMKTDEGWLSLDPGDLLRASAAGKYVVVHTPRGRIIVRQSLTAFAARLDRREFARVHRGEVVRFDAIARYEPQIRGDGILTLRDGTAIALSRTFRGAFLERFRQG